MRIYQQYFVLSVLILLLHACFSSNNPEKKNISPATTNSVSISKIDSSRKDDKSAIQFGSLATSDRFLVYFKEEKYIDIRRENPYLGLSLPVIYNAEDSTEFSYIIADQSKQLINSNFGDISSILNYDCDSPLSVISKSPYADIQANKIVVAYHISFLCNYEVIGTQGIAIIYDEYGRIIDQYKDQEKGFYDVRLSKNGKFLMQRYGFDYGEGGSGQVDHGFKLYDLKGHKKIGELTFEENEFTISYGANVASMGFHIVRATPNHWEWYCIDPKSQNYYLKTWNRIEFSANEFDKRSEKIDWSQVILDNAYRASHKIQKFSL